MTRSSVPYAEREVRPVAMAGAVDVTTPEAGFYRHKLRSGSVYVAVRIWHGPPHDPVTGEELDRSWRWQATANGAPIDLDEVWPVCAANPIPPAEYRRIIQQFEWAKSAAPNSAYAQPGRKIDLLSSDNPLPF